MPPSRRTGVSRPVVKQAPPPPSAPSIPQSTVPRPMAAAPSAHAPPAAAPMHHAPPPAAAPMYAPPPAAAPAAGGGMLSGLMGSVVQGMALGTGSAIANRAVDSVMGPRQMEVVHKDAPAAAAPAANVDACKMEWSSLQDCMKNAGSDASACQFLFESFNQCKRQNGLSA